MPFWKLQTSTNYFVRTDTQPVSSFSIPMDALIVTTPIAFGARSCEHIMTPATGFSPDVYCLKDTPDTSTAFCHDPHTS